MDIAVWTLPQGEIGIRGVAAMRENSIPCEGSRLPVAAYRIAEIHLFRRRSVGAQLYLQAVGWRILSGKNGPDTNIAVAIGYRAGPYRLESTEPRVELRDHLRQRGEFGDDVLKALVEPEIARRLHGMDPVDPGHRVELRIVADHDGLL